MTHALRQYPDVALDLDGLEKPLDIQGLFRQVGPVHIEIGSGKGTFLVQEAREHPQINYLGIEWARKYYRYAVDRIGRWALPNVRLLRTDAAAFLSEYVPETSIACVHLYFPDPWPKKRHHKRRFLCARNLDQLLRVLVPGGSIRIATDHAEYFGSMQGLIRDYQDRLERVLFHPTAGARAGEWVGTNFERKYLKEERSVFTLALRKRPT